MGSVDARLGDPFIPATDAKQMLGKNNVTPQVENIIAQAVNFEVTIVDMARRSERRAWLVAWSAILMALILAGGYFYFLPLKEKVPYLVMADAYTGTSTIARLTGNFGDQSIGTSEALNKSNIAHFVMARESYDNSQIGQRDWNTVHAMAVPQVTSGYAQLYSGTNPSNPITLFGKAKTIRVKILSLQLHGSPNTNEQPKTATVRFQRSLYDKAAGVAEPMDSKIATLEFVYKANLKMDETNRILNPLGFQVTGYRVDNDYAASPPVESPQADDGEPSVSAANAAGQNVSSQPDTLAPVSTAQTSLPVSNANGVNPK